MKLGTEVGLGPGHIVLDGDPAPPKWHSPSPPNYRSMSVVLLWSNGWMDQHATWYGGRARPRPHCDRWGISPPPGKGHSGTLFSANVYIVAKRSPISTTAEHLLNELRDKIIVGYYSVAVINSVVATCVPESSGCS